jgi:hypothetical protein
MKSLWARGLPSGSVIEKIGQKTIDKEKKIRLRD